MPVRITTIAPSEIAVVTHPGQCRLNTDAVAQFREPCRGRRAFAVAAALSDTAAGAWVASAAADHAVRATVADVDAAHAVLGASEIVRAATPAGDASLAVVMSPRPGTIGDTWTVGWAGACRVYTWGDDGLELLTGDHTAAHEMLAEDLRPAARWDRVLTNSVRRVLPLTVGLTVAAAPRWLVLVTPGLRRAVPESRLADLFSRARSARDKAELLQRAVRDADPRETATALIARCGHAASTTPVIPRPRRPATVG